MSGTPDESFYVVIRFDKIQKIFKTDTNPTIEWLDQKILSIVWSKGKYVFCAKQEEFYTIFFSDSDIELAIESGVLTKPQMIIYAYKSTERGTFPWT